MRPCNFIKGKIYYEVAFADRELQIPIIRSWVFLGTDIESEPGGNTKYSFQDVDSFIYKGHYSELPESTFCQLFHIEEPSLNSVFDFDGLRKFLDEVKDNKHLK